MMTFSQHLSDLLITSSNIFTKLYLLIVEKYVILPLNIYKV
jgi:hypothetical protein